MGASPEPRPAPRAKGAVAVARRDSARKKPLPDGLRKENSLKRRAEREREREREREAEAKLDVPADGGATAREGRPFTVSNVGNNGRIYLR
jgi:hypothetical protein